MSISSNWGSPLSTEASTSHLSNSFEFELFLAETDVLLGWGKSNQEVGLLTCLASLGAGTIAGFVMTVKYKLT